MNIDNISIRWLGHAGFIIENSTPKGVHPFGGKVIYIDPYNIREGLPKADVVLVTHSHYDHCSFADLEKIIKPGTRLLITADCQSKVTRFTIPVRIEIVEPNMEVDLGTLKVATVPAYNIDKHFHPKDEGWIGYIVKMNGVIIYHTGDTDFIPEMQKLTGYKQQNKKFVALLPIGGRFTMSVEEAIEAAKLIKPDLAIPMHWGSIVGSEDDAKEFKELCTEAGIACEIVSKE